MRLSKGGKRLEITEDAFLQRVQLEKMRAEEIVRWLKDRAGKTFSWSFLDRVGFFEEVYTEEGNIAHDYAVSRVMYDGERYMASDRDHGRRFWPCIFYTLEVSGACTVDGKSIFANEMLCAPEYFGETDLTRTRKQRAQVKDAIDEFCQAHPNVYLRIIQIGNRGPAEALAKHRANGLRVPFTDRGGQCTRAAVANAIVSLDGLSEAQLMLSKGALIATKLKDVNQWLQNNVKTFQLQRVEEPVHTEVDEWLRSVLGNDCVYIVRLVADRGRVDHCVVVDANQRVIFDCAEDFAVHACDGVLPLCVGDGCELEEVEIRKMVQLKKGTGKRRKKRNKAARERVSQEKRKHRQQIEKATAEKKRRVKRIMDADEEE